MQDNLLTCREVAKFTRLSRSSIYRLMKAGEFPRPIRVGPNSVRWRTSDIANWSDSRPTAES